jgi:hypothetical protein
MPDIPYHTALIVGAGEGISASVARTRFCWPESGFGGPQCREAGIACR